MSEQAANPTPKLTPKQQRFVEEYCVDWNGTQAAIRAGYSEDTAYKIASENLRKPQIKAAVDARLHELSLSAGQTTKLISEIAETRLNEFVVIRQVPRRTRVEAYAQTVAAQLREEIALIDESIMEAGLKKKEAAPLRAMQTKMRKQLIEYELEVKRFGKLAIVYVEGPVYLEDVAELDLVALAKAKEGGRIKSWETTEFGVKVQTFDSLAALRDMGRVHGIFEKDNSQAAAVAVINTKTEIINTGPPIARSEKEVDDV